MSINGLGIWITILFGFAVVCYGGVAMHGDAETYGPNGFCMHKHVCDRWLISGDGLIFIKTNSSSNISTIINIAG
jgi:hypothetical protein